MPSDAVYGFDGGDSGKLGTEKVQVNLRKVKVAWFLMKLGIKADKLEKGYMRGGKVLNDLSFFLPHGENMVITGASGTGKTTLLRLLAGLERPDAGEVLLDGEIISSAKRVLAPHLRGMGFVFQSPALWPHMTVRENIMFGLHDCDKETARQRTDEMLQAMEVYALAERYPHQLSGGEAKRVAVARTFAPCPRIILLDEALVNLQRKLKEQLLEFILAEAKKNNASLLYVTHDEREAERIGGERLDLENG